MLDGSSNDPSAGDGNGVTATIEATGIGPYTWGYGLPMS